MAKGGKVNEKEKSKQRAREREEGRKQKQREKECYRKKDIIKNRGYVPSLNSKGQLKCRIKGQLTPVDKNRLKLIGAIMLALYKHVRDEELVRRSHDCCPLHNMPSIPMRLMEANQIRS